MIGVRIFTVTTDSIKPLPVHHSTADFLQRVYKIPLTVLHLPTLLHNVAVPTPIDYPLMAKDDHVAVKEHTIRATLNAALVRTLFRLDCVKLVIPRLLHPHVPCGLLLKQSKLFVSQFSFFSPFSSWTWHPFLLPIVSSSIATWKGDPIIKTAFYGAFSTYC